MQVNVFGSLDTFIMTVLVDLYRVMGAAILVCAESQLWDLQHANSSSTTETCKSKSPVNWEKSRVNIIVTYTICK